MVNLKKIIFTFFIFISSAHAKVIQYHFDINTKTVNYAGKNVEALTINGQIPAPTIEATVGDTLVVTFDNKLHEDSSIHWHGIILPNDQDGVPYLTTQPIRAHSSFTYRFIVKQSGTYWYHSHTGLQEQRGIYGSLVFHPKNGERIKTDRDYVVVFSDWTNEKPSQVLANLKKDGDWYALKKKSVQSWDQVIQHGYPAIVSRLDGAWRRMGPMDLSDVGYDAFLSNGKEKNKLFVSPGETVRLRLINAAASSYFYVEYAGGPMTVVSADGLDIEPINVKKLRMAVAETYDVVLHLFKNNSYELRATSEDGTGYTSTFIGEGSEQLAPSIPRPNLFLADHKMHGMNHDAQAEHSIRKEKNNTTSIKGNNYIQKNHKHKKHHEIHEKTLAISPSPIINEMMDYRYLNAIDITTLPNGTQQRKIVLQLTGNMERYVWTFNDKTLLEADKILIKKGENVKLVLINQTMMHHPIHLHGHFFRVLNGNGERSPLKHTVNVPPMETVEIEFAATEEKDWFLHCHNLYHMATGMAGVVSYQDSTTANQDVIRKLSHDRWYFMSDIAALSQMTMGKFSTSNTRNAFEIEYDYNYDKEYDIDVTYARNFTRFLDIYAGANLEREDKNEKPEKTAIIGFNYVLPLLLETDFRFDSNRRLRFAVGSMLQLTERGKFNWMWNTDDEYRLSLAYEINKNILLTAAYDSDFNLGAGLRLIF